MIEVVVYVGLSVWASAVIGGLIGHFVNRRVLSGIVLGLLLGPLGWLIVFFLADNRPRCPKCRGVVELKATVCPHCRGSLVTYVKPNAYVETFCQRCGVDGLSSIEFGVPVYRCPKCGARL